MKRWPLVATFILFIALCVSAAFWVMQLFKPPVRAVAAPPQAAQVAMPLDATASLFGGRPVEVVVASNFQLTGVVVAPDPQDSIAILVTDTKPPQSVRVNAEIMPGVSVKEVYKTHVLLLERGVVKRVELPNQAKALSAATTPPVPVPLDSRIQLVGARPSGYITPSAPVSAQPPSPPTPPGRPADGRTAAMQQAQQQQEAQQQQIQQERQTQEQSQKAAAEWQMSPQSRQRNPYPVGQ